MENIDIKNIQKLEVKSHIFKHNGDIPDICFYDGKNIFPTLKISNIPVETQTLVLIIEDKDTLKEMKTHFIAWNIHINGEIEYINEKILKKAEKGINDFGVRRWLGLYPPKGGEKHRYSFQIYGLDRHIHISNNSTKDFLIEIIKKYNILVSYGEIIGTYGR